MSMSAMLRFALMAACVAAATPETVKISNFHPDNQNTQEQKDFSSRARLRRGCHIPPIFPFLSFSISVVPHSWARVQTRVLEDVGGSTMGPLLLICCFLQYLSSLSLLSLFFFFVFCLCFVSLLSFVDLSSVSLLSLCSLFCCDGVSQLCRLTGWGRGK